MLTKLKDNDNNTSKKMRTALMICIHECRTDMSGLLQYLRNGQSSVQVKEEIVTVSSSFKCRKLLIELLKRLNASNPALVRASVESDTLDLTKEPEMVPEFVSNPLSIEEELDCVIKEGQSPMQPVRYETLLSKILKEMTLFENGDTCVIIYKMLIHF